MKQYCEECRDLHEEHEICPKFFEQFKQHPEWFSEIVQTIANASVANPIVQKYGNAVKEHLVAYCGVDNQTSQHFTRSLKSISQQKTNPNYEYQNLKQRAGFTAEVQESARVNAERAIQEQSGRVVRYDEIGTVNHPLYDLIDLDSSGNVIHGTGVQMKFLGGTPSECWRKVTSATCQKYIDSNTPIQVPSDYYDRMLVIADEEYSRLTNQYRIFLAKNEHTKADFIKQRILHCNKTKGLLRKSKVSSTEAMYAVVYPEHYTAAEIIHTAHQAGFQASQSGALIGGGISILRNVVRLKNGDIEASDAIKNVALDTGKGAIGGYVVGTGGAILKGVMQNSSSDAIRILSETQFPSGAIGLAYGITKSALTKFIQYKNGYLSRNEMMKAFSRDAVQSSMVTCSLAMISFPTGLVGTAAVMGVAIYFDAVCANILDEVFGDGLYAQILHSSGYIMATAQNSVELLKQIKENAKSTEQSLYESDKSIREIRNKRIDTETTLDECEKMLEEL